MHCTGKRVLIPFTAGRPAFPGFVTYLDSNSHTLLARHGWVDASDTYDDFADRISKDNGSTWSEPRIRYQKYPVDNGAIRFTELAAFLDEDVNKLHTFVAKRFYPGDGDCVVNQRSTVEFQTLDNNTNCWSDPEDSDFGFPQGLCISFCFPIKTHSEKILVPAYKHGLDDKGNIIECVIDDNTSYTMFETLTLVGTYDQSGQLCFAPGKPLKITDDKSTRGLSENTIFEIRPGEIVQIARGSNAGRKASTKGCKWVSWSEDEGMTWSSPTELLYDDGTTVPSSATGCAVFRSRKTGKAYLIGNIADNLDDVDGNWPRSPLVIAEIEEENFAVKRSTVTLIDKAAEGESEYVQMSNFRYYQDRVSGDLVLHLARYGERGGLANWKDADFYEYRICLS